MIAKIIAYGRDRDEALGRLRRAMAETTVIIEGGATNKSFVLDLLDQPEVIDASADTGWIDRVRGEGRLAAHRHSAVALAAAAIEAYERRGRARAPQRLLATARGGRPQVQHDPGRPLDLKLRGTAYRVRVAQLGARRFRVGITVGGPASARPTSRSSGSTRTAAGSWSTASGSGSLPPPTGRSTWSRWTASPTGSAGTRAASSARPPRRWSSPPRSASATRSRRTRPILVLESMKMETVLRAPFRARVKECPRLGGQPGRGGGPLLRLEPLGEDADAEAAGGAAGPGQAAGHRPAGRAGQPAARPPGPSAA